MLLGAFQARVAAAMRTAPPIRSCSPASAVAGVVLGALYMLGFAQNFLFGAAKAPHQPFSDLELPRGRDPLRDRRRGLRARPLSRRADEDHRARGAPVPAAGQQRAHRRRRVASRAAAGRDARGACRSERPDERSKADDDLDRLRRRHAAGAPAARRHRRAARPRDRARRRAARRLRRVARGRDARHGGGGVARARHLRLRAVPRAFLGGSRRRRPARPSCWRSRCSCSSSRATISRRARSPSCCCPRCTASACMLSSDSFLTLFLGLELMSLPVYALVLLAYRRPESRRGGAQVPGAGRHRHGDAADGRLAALRRHAARCRSTRSRPRCSRDDTMARVAVLLVLVAFFLKAAIVPFHAWAPDAYEGAAVPVTAYMATIVKAGVLLAAVRLFGLAPLSPAMADARRAPAARVDRLGQPRRDAAAELPPHDRLFVHRARGLSLLRVPGRRPGPVPGGRVLRARLRHHERAGARGAAARRRATPRAIASTTSAGCSTARPRPR